MTRPGAPRAGRPGNETSNMTSRLQFARHMLVAAVARLEREATRDARYTASRCLGEYIAAYERMTDMTMLDRDTAEPIRELTAHEERLYLATIGNDPIGYVRRDLFDPGMSGVVYAI